MDNFEFNKVFAAVLCAGIVAMLGGFIAKKLVHPHDLEKDAVSIEGSVIAAAAAGPAKPQLPEPILHLIATADIAKGQSLARACAACHSFEKGGPVKAGPTLWNVVQAPLAAKDGFGYSDALREYGGAWTYEELNGFLWKPKKWIKGTKMNYIGLKKPEDRAAMVAWLRTLSSAPAALPSQADIDAEKAKFSGDPAPAE